MDSITGIIHLLLVPTLIIGSIFNKTIRTFFICYIELELLSWILFKKECLISYTYKKDNNPKYTLGKNTNLDDMTIPEWVHNIAYIIRIVFYSTASTWYYTLILTCFYIIMRVNNTIIKNTFWSSYWRYLLVPILLWLFHGYNAPFDFFAKKKHKTTIYVTIIVFAIYLGYILLKYPSSTYLYEPTAICYALLAFIGIGTSL